MCDENGGRISAGQDLVGGNGTDAGPEDLTPHLYLYEGEDSREAFLSRCLQPRFHGSGGAANPGTGEGSLWAGVELQKTGLILNKLVHRAFFVAKRVRTETKIASQAVSVSFAAVELAKKILGELEDKRVLVIGAGEMSELAARHFLSQGVRGDLRHQPHVFAGRRAGRGIQRKSDPFRGISPVNLQKMDIVLSSTGSTEYLVRREELTSVIRRRGKIARCSSSTSPFLGTSIPKINEIDNVYVYDIDDLEGIVEANKEERKKEVAQGAGDHRRGGEILQPMAARPRSRSHHSGPAGTSGGYPPAGGSQDPCPDEELLGGKPQLLEALATSIINKILHHPISMLKHQEERGHGKTLHRYDPEDLSPRSGGGRGACDP